MLDLFNKTGSPWQIFTTETCFNYNGSYVPQRNAELFGAVEIFDLVIFTPNVHIQKWM